MRRLIFAIGLLIVQNCFANEWQFSKPIVVSQANKGVYQHLDASSRRAIAISNKMVAVTWEDNSNGVPEIYVALKSISDQSFIRSFKVSETGPAYEPCIVGLNDGRFIIAWEADKRIWFRVISETLKGNVSRVTKNDSRQVVLYVMPENNVIAAWAEKREKVYQIYYAKIKLNKASVNLTDAILVDKSKVKADQAYPSLYQSNKGTVVAWEDRRFGNTQIFTAFAKPGGKFSPHRVLNDFRPSRIARFGNGSGAMRVTISGNTATVLATWLDKRDFEGGYDVYAAMSEDGGETFSDDELVQDMFGENIPQWHNSGAVSHDNKMVSVWDDTRDEMSRLWFSERVEGKWTEDISLTENDEAKETHPVFAFDSKGQIHIAYIHRIKNSTRILYLMGHR